MASAKAGHSCFVLPIDLLLPLAIVELEPYPADNFQDNRSKPYLCHSQLLSGTIRQVNDSSLGKVSTICNPYHDRVFIVEVHYTHH